MGKQHDLRDTVGTIFNTQHFCIHDGPGIRTTVFFKGCPLRCLWCHNPEGLARARQPSFAENQCVGCGACAQILPDASMDALAAVCPTGARSVVGTTVATGDLLALLLRDRRYYGEDGGVTFSGGEPTMQPVFLEAMLRLSVEAGLHTALETSGFCEYAILERIAPDVGLFLFDYKESDPARHRELTGVDSGRILDNLRRLHDAGAKVLLRCPIIPGLNDRDEHFAAIARMTCQLPGLLGAELLPYHRLAASKAQRVGLLPQTDYEPPSAEMVADWKRKVREAGERIVEG